MKRWPVFATAIIRDKRGKVLSIGKNSYKKSHPYQAHLAAQVGLPEKIFIHAEVDAIIRCRNLRKANSIEVFKLNANSKRMKTIICPICMSAIKEAGIKHIKIFEDLNEF
jgi:deoxycytidylate deaminase